MRLMILFALVGFSAQVMATDIAPTTWAKSQVSYDQFKRDSVECAYVGYYRDISQDVPALRFIAGWRAADTALNMPGGNGDGWSAAVARTQPDRRKSEIHALQTSDVENCLSDRGYSKVYLDGADIKKLSTLKKGTEARRRYLYAIASR